MKYTLARHLLYSLSQKEVRKVLRWSNRIDKVIWARRGFAKTWQRRAAKMALFLVGLAGFLWLISTTRGQREMSVWSGLVVLGLCAHGAAVSAISYPSQYRSVALRRLERLRINCAVEHREGRCHQNTLVLQDPSKPPFNSVAACADPIMVSSRLVFVMAMAAGGYCSMRLIRTELIGLFVLPMIFVPLLAPKVLAAIVRRRVRTARAKGHCPDCDYDLLPDNARPESCLLCPECGLRYPLFDMVEYLSRGAASVEKKPDPSL